MNRLMTVREVAERLDLSESMVYGWCASGRLPHLRLGGQGRRGVIKIDEDDLKAFLASCRRQQTPPADAAPEAPPLRLKHLRF